MMKTFTLKFAAILTACIFTFSSAKADEGMWLWMYLNKNMDRMQELGIQLSAEDIYSVNNSSMKDAIVSLGGFCSAEFISAEGLLLTNHHCAYGSIQEHSSVEANYLDDGFWALSKDQELPASGVYASILVRMDDVTERVMNAAKGLDGIEAAAAIRKETDAIKTEAEENSHYNARVTPVLEGNQYLLFVYETFNDVRLVGAPPQSIGKYGGDTDNWMWPRHTGDFSLFRVYSGPDGKPAEYSEENIPYQPNHHLPISIDGVKEGDFAMVMGFPGRTQRYKTSFGIAADRNQSNPLRVDIRTKKLEVWKADMDASEKVRIQYSSKYSGVSNYWKYFIGQNQGLDRLNTIEKKKEMEAEFTEWVNANPERRELYGEVLSTIETCYDNMAAANEYINYLSEAAFGIEALGFSARARGIHAALSSDLKDDAQIASEVEALKGQAEEFFKNYSMSTDKKMFVAMMEFLVNGMDEQYFPASMKKLLRKNRNDLERLAGKLYGESIFTSQEEMMDFLADPSLKTIEKDAFWSMYNEMIDTYRSEVMADMQAEQAKLSQARKLLVKGLMEMNPEKNFYPDANSTPRLSFGSVTDYSPKDAVQYNYYTTLEGVFEKENPEVMEFTIPEELKDLYENKDYGQYADENGELVTCFITNNDITGGNSGSPVIDAKGRLIGTAFDGNWEAMTGDLVFDKEYKRCINVDVRYTLFVIDKIGKAQNLIDEMTIIKTEDSASEYEMEEVKESDMGNL